jgi:hypothetical protein
MTSNRREFLKGMASAGFALGAATALPGALRGLASTALPSASDVAISPGSCDFVFFTDTHIQPELAAAKGCAMCFKKIASLKPEFAIHGGDHVFDALGVDAARATRLYNLYKKTESSLGMPLYQTIGNHDAFGVLTKSGVSPGDPGYGKKLYEERMGKTYYSFAHKGYLFVVLDSIQTTDDRFWEARVDEAQLDWLGGELRKAGPTAPVIVVTRVPLVSAFSSYAEKPSRPSKYPSVTVGNASDVLNLFAGHNVIAVLQGHLHINELVSYKNTQYITNGAVCGNWWHGPRLGVAEGFTVVSLRNGALSTRYETYGFQSVDPREKF